MKVINVLRNEEMDLMTAFWSEMIRMYLIMMDVHQDVWLKQDGHAQEDPQQVEIHVLRHEEMDYTSLVTNVMMEITIMEMDVIQFV